jgi:hypothetical protein
VRRCGVAHLLGPGRRRGLEDVGVTARPVQEAVGAGGQAGHAHGALQGMAEDAAPGGARVARQAQIVDGPEHEPIATERQRDPHSFLPSRPATSGPSGGPPAMGPEHGAQKPCMALPARLDSAKAPALFTPSWWARSPPTRSRGPLVAAARGAPSVAIPSSIGKIAERYRSGPITSRHDNEETTC